MNRISNRTGLRVLALAAALALAGAAQASIVNGGFESGDFEGWTVSGDTAFAGVANGVEHSGAYGAFFGSDPSTTISQVLATSAGASYVIDFWLSIQDSATPNRFAMSWEGVDVIEIVDSPAFGYTHFSAKVTASGSSSALAFTFSNPPSFTLFDDVAMAVPLPASAALAGLGLVLLGASQQRRQHRPLDLKGVAA